MVIVGANSDSARISFFGSTKGELAQKWDGGKDAVGLRLTQVVPPEPREMVTLLHGSLTLPIGYLTYLLFIRLGMHATKESIARILTRMTHFRSLLSLIVVLPYCAY